MSNDQEIGSQVRELFDKLIRSNKQSRTSTNWVITYQAIGLCSGPWPRAASKRRERPCMRATTPKVGALGFLVANSRSGFQASANSDGGAPTARIVMISQSQLADSGGSIVHNLRAAALELLP